jgi:hypothetical protein
MRNAIHNQARSAERTGISTMKPASLATAACLCGQVVPLNGAWRLACNTLLDRC